VSHFNPPFEIQNSATIAVFYVVQGIRIAPNFEDIFDESSAHKMHALIANYKRYVCVCVCVCVFDYVTNLF
jgi:hypothetical protein